AAPSFHKPLRINPRVVATPSLFLLSETVETTPNSRSDPERDCVRRTSRSNVLTFERVGNDGTGPFAYNILSAITRAYPCAPDATHCKSIRPFALISARLRTLISRIRAVRVIRG